MGSESAFRKLLLDTVSTIIQQPPSTSALIELLRVASPQALLTSNDTQRTKSSEIVKNVQQREKLYRTLQLRIHPDKHVDGGRATELFQEVTSFYEKCVAEMEREDNRQQRQRSSDMRSGGVANTNANAANNGCGGQRNTPERSKSRQYEHPTKINNPRRPDGASTHSDYENCSNNFDNDYPANRRGYDYPANRRYQRHNKSNNRRQQPSNHMCMAITSTILFPPLGICALLHSLKVNKTYDNERYQDAKYHSDQAYNYAWFGCLCFVIMVICIWLRDGDADWDWDKVKHDYLPSWDNGP